MQSDKIALFLGARPTYNFHVVDFDDDNTRARSPRRDDRRTSWINGGYFVFRREIFDYIRDGEELVEEPFQRLIEEDKLIAYPYEGFWAPMDTLKDKHDARDAARGRARALAKPERRADGTRASRSGLTCTPSALGRRTSRLPACSRSDAHSDDIEIGCGGTILSLVQKNPEVEVKWVVLSATGSADAEARASAASFLAGHAPRAAGAHRVASATASSRTSVRR